MSIIEQNKVFCTNEVKTNDGLRARRGKRLILYENTPPRFEINQQNPLFSRGHCTRLSVTTTRLLPLYKTCLKYMPPYIYGPPLPHSKRYIYIYIFLLIILAFRGSDANPYG